jgi:hypothetical protein
LHFPCIFLAFVFIQLSISPIQICIFLAFPLFLFLSTLP